MVTKINAMNNTMENSWTYKRNKVYQLKLSDYEITDERPCKDGRVTKWVKVGNKDEQIAFKIISEELQSLKNFTIFKTS